MIWRSGCQGWLAGATLLIPALAAGCAPQRSARELDGVVVEHVEPGYAAARAGLEPGDVLLGWRPADGDRRDWIPLAHPLDVLLAEMSGGQLGRVAVDVRRDRASRLVTISPAPWKLVTRPLLSGKDEVYVAQAHALLADERADEAAERLQQVAVGTGTALEAWLATTAARALSSSGREEEANDGLLRALTAAEASSDADLLAWVWFKAGKVHERAKDFDAAIVAYERGLEVEDVRWELVAGLRRALADTRFRRTSDHATVGRLFQEVRAEWSRHGTRPPEYVIATIGLGKVDRNLSRFERAQARFSEALDLARDIAPDHPYVGLALQESGTLAYWQSDLASAERLYREASEILGELGIADQNLAILLMGLGGVAQQRGDLTSAEASFAQALTIFERDVPGSLLVSWSLRGLGTVARIRNELLLAHQRYEDALEILAPEAVYRADRGLALTEHGAVAYERGDLATARKSMAEAVRIFDSEFPDVKFGPRARTSLAVVLLETNEVPAAREHLMRALSEWERLIPGGLDQAETYFYLGELYRQTGELELARRHHASALAIRSRLAPRSSIEAVSHHSLGRVSLAAGDNEEALAHRLRALDAVEAQLGNLGVSEVSRARYRQRHGDVYRETISLLLDLGRPQAAFDVLERYRTQQERELVSQSSLEALEAGAARLLERRARLVREYEATWLRLSKADPGPAGRAEVEQLRGRLAALEQERQVVRAEIRSSSPNHALADPVPARWDDLSSRLSTDVGVLSYFITPSASWLFSVRSGTLEVSKLAANGEELERLVDRFRLLLAAEGPDGAGRRALDSYGRKLYRLLVAPAEALIEPAAELVILADGPLSVLPFAALVRASTPPQYLVEWKPLSRRASSAGLSREPRVGGQRRDREWDSNQLLAFGGVSGPHAASPGWQSLPFAAAEAATLGALFAGRSEVRLGAMATEEAAKRKAPDFRYLHFSTHAQLDSVQPFDSALVLSPVEGASGGADGMLRAWEVVEEMSLDAEVVTLSACESALGEIAGPGLMGLTQAFRLAGARSVAASLWRVDDRSTAALMTRFYEGLSSGLEPAQALGQAQRDLIRGTVAVPPPLRRPLDRLRIRMAHLFRSHSEQGDFADYSHPHYWAAFQVYR